MWQQNVRPSNCNASNIINKVSKIFQPTTITPKNAQPAKGQDITSKSQRLMLELGIMKAATSGIFHLLPLGMRAYHKLLNLVDREMHSIGAQKVMFPTLTNLQLWKKTGRFHQNNSELFTLQDRHNHSYLLSPTHEEAASDLLTSLSPLSHRTLPLRLYQVTSKYRDEMKPRFGLMRARQFEMKDLYTFDVDVKAAEQTYLEVCESYDRIFRRIGVEFIKVVGTSGMMGGLMSHEYHYKAPVGEDRLVMCSDCGYSANVEHSGDEKCPNCCKSNNLEIFPGIEVGHTFLLGEKYSKPLGVRYLSETRKPEIVQMGSYGLGLTRILAAVVEVLCLEQEIRWPRVLAPYAVVIIPPKEGSKEEPHAAHFAEKLYNLLESHPGLQGNVLLDDRTHMTIGRRMLDARRTGYPYVIVVGAKATEEVPLFELNDLEEKTQLFLPQADLLKYLTEKYD